MFLKIIFTISTSCVQHSELRLVFIALQYINNKQKTSKLNLYRNPISLTKKNIFKSSLQGAGFTANHIFKPKYKDKSRNIGVLEHFFLKFKIVVYEQVFRTVYLETSKLIEFVYLNLNCYLCKPVATIQSVTTNTYCISQNGVIKETILYLEMSTAFLSAFDWQPKDL